MTAAFYSAFRISAEVVYLQRYLVVTRLVPRETAAVSAHVLCAPYNHAPVTMSLHSSRIRRVRVCLAVTCHPQFGRMIGIFHVTAATQGQNKYLNNSQHRKLILEKKIRPTLLPRLQPETFRLHNSFVCCPPTLSAPLVWVLKRGGRNTTSKNIRKHEARPPRVKDVGADVRKWAVIKEAPDMYVGLLVSKDKISNYVHIITVICR